MSKPVRLSDYLYAEVEKLAVTERRSTANMVRVLLEQALKLESSGAAVGYTADSGSAASTGEEQDEGSSASQPVRPERAAPDSPKKRFHPCKHHVPPSKICQYCDVSDA